MIDRLTDRASAWRRPLFKLFRRKSRDEEEDTPLAAIAGADAEADLAAEAVAAETESALATVAVAEPEPDELPAEPEEGPAFDEDVEERTELALRPTRRGFFRRMFGVFERSQID